MTNIWRREKPNMLQRKDCFASEAPFSIYICKICWKTWKVTQKINHSLTRSLNTLMPTLHLSPLAWLKISSLNRSFLKVQDSQTPNTLLSTHVGFVSRPSQIFIQNSDLPQDSRGQSTSISLKSAGPPYRWRINNEHVSTDKSNILQSGKSQWPQKHLVIIV